MTRFEKLFDIKEPQKRGSFNLPLALEDFIVCHVAILSMEPVFGGTPQPEGVAWSDRIVPRLGSSLELCLCRVYAVLEAEDISYDLDRAWRSCDNVV